MKNVLKYFLLVLGVGMFSCSDDFLESEPTEFISADRMSEMAPFNPEIFNGTIRGMYTLMYQTGTGGTNLDHDDFGQKGYDIYSDMLCGDMVLGGYNYGWYSDVATMAATEDYNDIDNYKPWRYYYRIIRAANSIIDGLGGNDFIPEDQEVKWQIGQAKTMRAYAYFNLAHLFVEEHDMNADILPLYVSADQPAQPLSTGAEIWGLIKSDLEQSVKFLEGYKREGLQGVNEDVANGWLAYTYLTLGDYDLAASTAQKVIDKGYGIVPPNLVAWNGENTRSAFSYVDGAGADWIWGMDLTLDQGLDLVSWYGQVDYYTYSYAAVGDPKGMDVGLYNSIRPTDVRGAQFASLGGTYIPYGKFYHEERKAFNQREITADYVYMRVEEMHLIKAEALAFDNQDAAAQTALLELLNYRDSDVDYVSTLTGQDLKDEIYKQWRIEMWGEGKSYYAMMRNKATITREGHIEFNGDFEYNDDRLSFDIPYQEIQDNPHIN